MPIDAIKCKYCTGDIDPVVADEDEARQVATEKRVAE
ncbi:hypothetical protein FHX44_11757 [Pseudonocardia hierapolitana]|uniref:Uncharacterized protein n=1 Tax=Pseudonocardia hierapolitana TaxID=1128676 RepID=A0A561SJ49_9PSEU|nr:hypothetical protein FHX44_11757 [Pseudonocardia hierapolitana]